MILGDKLLKYIALMYKESYVKREVQNKYIKQLENQINHRQLLKNARREIQQEKVKTNKDAKDLE